MARSSQVLEAAKDMPKKLSQAYSKQFPSAAKGKMKNLQGAAQRRLGGAQRMQQGSAPGRMPSPSQKNSQPQKAQKSDQQKMVMNQMKQKVKQSATSSPRNKAKSQVQAHLSKMTGKK